MRVPEEHRAHGPSSVACGVITVSDSRGPESDDSGKLIQDLLARSGHTVPFYTVVKDDPGAIRDSVETAAQRCDVIITNGGTGVSRRDVTVPALAPRVDRVLPGFGELFRALSYDAIGSAAFLSGAFAAVYRNRLLFCLPGSPDGCRLAMEKLILPELGHVVGLLRR